MAISLAVTDTAPTFLSLVCVISTARYKLGVVGSVLSTLWFVCAIHTKITSLFVAVIAFKCFLNPTEVQSITDVAAPMTQKVSVRHAFLLSLSPLPAFFLREKLQYQNLG